MEKSMQHGKSMTQGHYARFLLMTVLSFIAMYILMYAMVDRLGNVFNSVNQFYMAGLMTAPMVILELLLMGGMYQDKKRNAILIGVGTVALILFWTLIRQQAAVDDRQFLRSMIPHHAGAILMCEEAKLLDPDVLQLCQGIVASQQSEIARMKTLLAQD